MNKGLVKLLSAALVIIMLLSAASTVTFAAAYEEPQIASAPVIEIGELDTAPVEATIPVAFNNNPDALPSYISSVKNQGEMGLCWAYAAVACAEADAMKNGGEDVPNGLDLSEWHLAYFTYNGKRGSTGDTVSVSGSTPYYDLGGYSDVIAMVLSNKIGFVTENKAPISKIGRAHV